MRMKINDSNHFVLVTYIRRCIHIPAPWTINLDGYNEMNHTIHANIIT